VIGIIVVFDKSNRKSFENLEKYVEEIKGHASHETIFIRVLGC
jgi:GTPase SAR1 family protein